MSRVTSTADAETAVMTSLYQQHAAPLWRFVLRLTGDASRAEDIVQETLLRAWQHPEVIGNPARPPRAWLYTVARNIVIDETRSARFRTAGGSLDEAGAPEQAAPDEADAAVDRLLIADAMAQMSADHRAVVERSYYRGWTSAQIAADLGIAEGTVKSRLHYAVRSLRLTMQEMGVTR